MTKNTTFHRRPSRARDAIPRDLDRMPISYRAEPCKDVRRRVVDNAMRTGKNAFPLTAMSVAFVRAVQERENRASVET